MGSVKQPNEVVTAIQGMYDLMEELADFGASDTEPRTVFAYILQDHLDGGPPLIPGTSYGWQLFTDMPGAADAARRLQAKAIEVIAAADANHQGFLAAMRYFF